MKDINVLLPSLQYCLCSNQELSDYNWLSSLPSLTDRPTLVRSQVATVPRSTTVPSSTIVPHYYITKQYHSGEIVIIIPSTGWI